MKSFGRALKAVFQGIFILIILVLVWLMAERLILKQEIPSLAGYSHLVVLSGSMEPEISAGDLIVIRRQDGYKNGDIITFSDETFYTTHRIIETEDDKYYTKGDANNVPDREPVLLSEVVGRVVLVIPAVGRILLFLRTPMGIVCLLLFGLLVLFVTERVSHEGKRCAGNEKTSD